VTWRYWAIFLGVLIGASGVPFPLVTLVVLSGFYAHNGLLSYPYAVAVVAVAAITGHNLGYLMGRWLGRAFFERYGRYVGVTPGRLSKVENTFARYGNKVILVAPFVWGLRSSIAPVCGLAKMRFRTFFVYNAVAAIVWDNAMMAIGFTFGQHWETAKSVVHNLSIVLAIALLGAVIYYRYRKKRLKIARKENG